MMSFRKFSGLMVAMSALTMSCANDTEKIGSTNAGAAVESLTSASVLNSSQIREEYLRLSSHAPTANELSTLHKFVIKHPVAGLDYLEKYDPQGIIGFCFGRAMAVHLFSKNMGMAQENVGKLFAIGDLRSGENPEWRFHVTTIIKDASSNWIAVDPIMDNPMTVSQWIGKVKEIWDRNSAAYYYIAPSEAVLPNLSVFNYPDKENGENIIELKFNPAGKEGLKARTDLGEKVFELSLPAAQKYFYNITGAASKDRFDFTELKINDQAISYNNYFGDLLTSAMNTSYSKIAGPAIRGERAPLALSAPFAIRTHTTSRTNNLYSPKLDALAR